MDVRLEGARRDAAFVRLAVRFHLVRLPRDERGGVGQILDAPVEFPDADPAVSTVTVHAPVAGVLADSLREDFDRVPVAARVADAAAEPDDRVRVVGGGLVVGPGGVDVVCAPGRDLGGRRWRIERLTQQGEGLRALGQRRSDGGRGSFARTALRGTARGEERSEECGGDEGGAAHVGLAAGGGMGACGGQGWRPDLPGQPDGPGPPFARSGWTG